MARKQQGERDGAAGVGDGDRGTRDAPTGERPSQEPRQSGLGPVAIIATEEELRIGEVAFASSRAALAELGAEGSRALDELSVQETIALLAGLEGLTSALESVQARALVQLEAAVKDDCLLREEPPRAAVKIARAEASRALLRSRSSAGQTMATCRRLVLSMPRMMGALAKGSVTPQSAHRVGRVLGPASPEQRRQVDQILLEHLPYLEGCGPREWGEEAERVLHGLDPDGAAARHQVAKQKRSVTVRSTEHGMSVLTAHLTGLDAARIRKGLSLAAEKARAEGDGRGHQQIMADLLADALIGRGDGIDPTTLDIGVIITDRSLFAPQHADSATIEGLGPVPYEHVREEMRRAVDAEEDADLALTLRRLYTDPEDGQLVAVESRSREFPPALARFLRWSHQSCRGPFCEANIRQSDHIVPWSQGGATSLHNGNGLCVGDNQKEETGETARVITDEDGTRRTVEWTTRYGQRTRRGAVNHDPVGTAKRRQERRPRRDPQSEQAPGHAPAPSVEQPVPPKQTKQTVAREQTAERGTRTETTALLRHALHEIEQSHPGLPAPPRIRGRRGHSRHWPQPYRLDYIERDGWVVGVGKLPYPPVTTEH